MERAVARGETVYTDAYSLLLARHTAGYERERAAIEAYRLIPVGTSEGAGRVLLYRLERNR